MIVVHNTTNAQPENPTPLGTADIPATPCMCGDGNNGIRYDVPGGEVATHIAQIVRMKRIASVLHLVLICFLIVLAYRAINR